MSEQKNGSSVGKFDRKGWVWIMLMTNIVFILLFITIGLVALRVNNILPENADILFVVSKEPEFYTDDNKGAWQKGRQIDIFKADYENGEGKVTVASVNGDKAIAPGTETTYRFAMYNSGNMAVNYATDLFFILKVGNEVVDSKDFPLQVRMTNSQGEYLIGSESEWVRIGDETLTQYSSVLGASSYEDFELHLHWEFSGGNDELDTLYGDLAAEKGVSLTLGINTYAVEHNDPKAQGGLAINSDTNRNQEYGGTFRWVWLIMLMANAGILVFYIAWLMNKRLHDKTED